MRLKILHTSDVAEMQICTGCGACAYLDPDQVKMVDTLDHGRRPFATEGLRLTSTQRDAMAACPGFELSQDFDRELSGLVPGLFAAWGPVLEVWEGYATAPDIRYAGSSGGVASALSLWAIERVGMHGVLHTAARPDAPYLNHTVMSRTRGELLARAGSRYAPASPCEGLQQIEDASAPCVFIGKPCDVAGAVKSAAIRPKLAEKLGLTIAVFCAGTPSTRGTLEMLKRMGIDDPSSLVNLRYRGNGWPGKATAVFRLPSGQEETRQLTYQQSWGEVLAKHVQWRCRLCPDHTGEFADIAVGDPWHKPPIGDEPGRSMIVVRTARGRELLHAAIAAGYIAAQRVAPDSLPAAQPNLLRVRASVWGRIWACRVLGVPTPRYRRMPCFKVWWSVLGWREKVQSVVGTMKRVFRRQLTKRATLVPYQPQSAEASSERTPDPPHMNGR